MAMVGVVLQPVQAESQSSRLALSWVGGHLAPSKFIKINEPVNSCNGTAMMTAP